MPKKSVIILSTITSLVLLSNIAILTTWQATFPGFPIFGSNNLNSNLLPSVKDSISLSKTKNPTDISSLPADSLANQLLSTLILPNGWIQGETTNSVTSSPIDLSCSQINPIQPVVSRTVSLDRISGELSGGIAQVTVYPAGLGAIAIANIEKQVKSCHGNAWINNSPSLGFESLSVDDSHGNLFSSGPSARTIWTRQGDIVAFVSIRGNHRYNVDQIISDWFKKWDSILSIQDCINLKSTIGDSVRSPLSKNYQGLLESKQLVLTPEESALADAQGQKLIATEANSKGISNYTILDTPVTLPKVIKIINYPISLNPILPSNRPVLTPAPIYPTKPIGITISGLIPDSTGPGCGWALTGETPPIATNQSLPGSITNLLADGKSKLINEQAQRWLDQWNYKQVIQPYSLEIESWNSWANQANAVITQALWADYDNKIIIYNQAISNYIILHQNWLNACPNTNPSSFPTPSSVNSSPSSSPTASATPSQSSSSTDCPIEPIKPVAPSEPSVPRI